MTVPLADRMNGMAARPQNSLRTGKWDTKRYLFGTMPALVIKSFPEDLHVRLRQIAAKHRRSVTQQTIHLIEQAISSEDNATQTGNLGRSKWANRKLLPEYEALLKSGALASDVDSTVGLSEERDAR
jgi:plasmid stability protein